MRISPSFTALTLGVCMMTGCSQPTPDKKEVPVVSEKVIVPEVKFITIGTGGVMGIYYPTGGSICRMVKATQSPFRCAVESTRGSVYNVKTINEGELDFGISQSDTAYQAFSGEGKFSSAPITDLRSVMAIYPELLSLAVRDDSGISTLADVKGKHLNVDVAGSGTRMTTEAVFAAKGITLQDLDGFQELKYSENPTMLQDKEIDGYFCMVGHPTASIKDASNSVDLKLVPIKGAAIDKLVAEKPYYAKGIIEAKNYKGIDTDVPSFGVKALLVTHADMSDEAVKDITRAVLDNFDEFKHSHPAYKNITKESLLEGLAIPQHLAATAVFDEKGITNLVTQ